MLGRERGLSVTAVVMSWVLLCTGASSVQAQDVVVHVNDHEISSAMLNLLAHSREKGPFAEVAHNREQILHDLINTELLYQAAKQAGIDQQEEASLELELAHKTLMSQLYVMQFMESLPIEEDALRALYDATPDRIMVQMARWDFPDQAAAQQFLKSVSAGETPVPEGEVEPWQSSDNFGFADQLSTLNKQDWLPEVVKSEHGWQVWRIIDRSKISKPPYERARESLRQEVAQQQLQGHIAKLKEQAKIRFIERE